VIPGHMEALKLQSHHTTFVASWFWGELYVLVLLRSEDILFESANDLIHTKYYLLSHLVWLFLSWARYVWQIVFLSAHPDRLIFWAR
jgi:hypothetical protein